jgi:hypothetical protein
VENELLSIEFFSERGNFLPNVDIFYSNRGNFYPNRGNFYPKRGNFLPNVDIFYPNCGKNPSTKSQFFDGKKKSRTVGKNH